MRVADLRSDALYNHADPVRVAGLTKAQLVAELTRGPEYRSILKDPFLYEVSRTMCDCCGMIAVTYEDGFVDPEIDPVDSDNMTDDGMTGDERMENEASIQHAHTTYCPILRDLFQRVEAIMDPERRRNDSPNRIRREEVRALLALAASPTAQEALSEDSVYRYSDRSRYCGLDSKRGRDSYEKLKNQLKRIATGLVHAPYYDSRCPADMKAHIAILQAM